MNAAVRLLAFAAVAAWSTTAMASKKDDLWAACLWDDAPTTAANWIAMSPSTERGLFTAPEAPEGLLQYRLRAACDRRLTPAGKKWAIGFSPKGVRAALMASRPAVIGPDKFGAKAFRCDYYFEDDLEFKTRARFEWGIEDARGRQVWTTVDYGFARQGGGAISLTKGAGLKKCFNVQADGTLANA